jgi:cell wall-associated NlpC family hydrolase
MQCVSGVVDVLTEPRPGAAVDTQLLYGEAFEVDREQGDFLFGHVHYRTTQRQGYVRREAFQGQRLSPTHVVVAPWTPLLSEPALKATVHDRLSIGSLLHVVDEDDDHYRVAPRGWIFKTHTAAAARAPFADFVAVAESMIGVPFVWGGRSAFGVDCSGVIYLALSLCGIASDRKMVHLRDTLGRPLGPAHRRRRGDFIFYSGHCGMFVGDDRVLNSNGKAGRVQVEPFDVLHDRMLNVRRYEFQCVRRLGESAPEALAGAAGLEHA